MDISTSKIGRRTFLKRLGAGSVTIGALAACSAVQPAAATPAATVPSDATAPGAGQATTPSGAAVRPEVVRLTSVPIPQESGLYAQLFPEFERRSGYKVEVTPSVDVYGPARAGRADIVLSHYQLDGLSAFVQDGLGEWPRTVFSSPNVLVGPPSDPAKVRGLTDVVEAFQRIAKAQAPFIVNDVDLFRYAGEVIWRAANVPTSGSWYLDKGTTGMEVIRAAAQAGGYTMTGLVLFLRQQQQAKLALEPLLTQDQLLRQVMVTITVSDKKVSGVNAKGAASLQQYLLEPETQAKVRTFRMAGFAEQVWWPVGHDNEKAVLSTR